MTRHLTNAAYGVLDYASYPMGMLLVAPVVLHRLGAAEYGLWITSTAIISGGGIVASGFCDANIQRIAQHRGADIENCASIAETAGSMLAINLAFGAIVAICAWLVAPFAASRIASAQISRVGEYQFCLRAASFGILLRAVETVAVSSHRAFEDYRSTVRISALCRLLTLGIDALLVSLGQGMISILIVTDVILALGAYLQFWSLHRFIGGGWLRPIFGGEARTLLTLGVFPWLQAVGSIIFGQLDRILLGIYAGTLVVAPYALCVQFAQSIIGVTASGLSFLFPYLSGRARTLTADELRDAIFKAFACNLLVVVLCATGLLVFAEQLIRIWAGDSVAHSASGLITPIVLGSALAALGTTAIYAMQALGQFRSVALISLSGRAGMLLVMMLLLRELGLRGLALSRLWYGLIPLLVYIPLLREIQSARVTQRKYAKPVCQEGSAL